MPVGPRTRTRISVGAARAIERRRASMASLSPTRSNRGGGFARTASTKCSRSTTRSPTSRTTPRSSSGGENVRRSAISSASAVTALPAGPRRTLTAPSRIAISAAALRLKNGSPSGSGGLRAPGVAKFGAEREMLTVSPAASPIRVARSPMRAALGWPRIVRARCRSAAPPGAVGPALRVRVSRSECGFDIA